MERGLERLCARSKPTGTPAPLFSQSQTSSSARWRAMFHRHPVAVPVAELDRQLAVAGQQGVDRPVNGRRRAAAQRGQEPCRRLGRPPVARRAGPPRASRPSGARRPVDAPDAGRHRLDDGHLAVVPRRCRSSRGTAGRSPPGGGSEASAVASARTIARVPSFQPIFA